MVQPWIFAVDLRVGRPAKDIGQFFAESFQRRTGKPLEIVGGDLPMAALVSLTAPTRPSLYLESAPEYLPKVTRKEIEEKGAVVVWPTTDTTSRPPPEILQQFPDLVSEVPRAFTRRFQGRMPLLRLGWGMVRPHTPGAVPELPPLPQPLPEPIPPPPPEPQWQMPQFPQTPPQAQQPAAPAPAQAPAPAAREERQQRQPRTLPQLERHAPQ
jgi:hypothetical protein